MTQINLRRTQSAALGAAYASPLVRSAELARWRRRDGVGDTTFSDSDLRFLVQLEFILVHEGTAFITTTGADYLFMYGEGSGQPLGILQRVK